MEKTIEMKSIEELIDKYIRKRIIIDREKDTISFKFGTVVRLENEIQDIFSIENFDIDRWVNNNLEVDTHTRIIFYGLVYYMRVKRNHHGKVIGTHLYPWFFNEGW